jgi:hypothetical protein
MAEFKRNGQSEAFTPIQKLVIKGDYEPLFGSNSTEDGGLIVLHDKQNSIAEIRPSTWALQPDCEPHHRVQPLHLHKTDSDIEFDGNRNWSPDKPGLGGEVETGVINVKTGNPWKILPDGKTLRFPGKKSATAKKYGLQPELLQTMVEYGTPYVASYRAHALQLGAMAAKLSNLLDKHGLGTPQFSVDPNLNGFENVSTDPWVQKISPLMPHILEFVCISSQLHVDQKSPEAALIAMNAYQPVQALFAVITEAAAIRDGSFETTLAQHYTTGPHQHPDYTPPQRALGLVKDYGQQVPHDWRQFSREFGSPSAGAFVNPLPQNIEGFLRAADSKLRAGEIISSDRTGGWHRDRFRPTMGTMEFNNLATAGGNLNKLAACQLFLGEFTVALQIHALKTGRTPEKLYGNDFDTAALQRYCDIGARNNFRSAMLDKRADMILPDGQHADTPSGLLSRLLAITETYVSVSPVVTGELFATLQEPPTPDDYRGADAETVIRDYYKPQSPMTANEANRLAHAVDKNRSVTELQQIWASVHRDHVRQWNKRNQYK